MLCYHAAKFVECGSVRGFKGIFGRAHETKAIHQSG
jgi:hypothetical protein